MKKTLIALAALAATASFAQSTVTLSGSISTGLLNTGAAGSKAVVSSLGGGANAINIVTVEDLGGGMTGGFDGQIRYLATTGDIGSSGDATSTALFHGANAYVGGAFGTVRVGKIIEASNCAFDPWGCTGGASLSGGLSSGTTGLVAAGTTANAVGYATPTISGFSASYTTSVSTRTNERQVLSLNYANGPVAVQYLARQGGANVITATGTAGADDNSKASSIAGSYDFGVAKLSVGNTVNKAATTGATTGDIMTVGVSVPMGAYTILAGYAKDKKQAAATDTKTALGVNYALSKRTTLGADVFKDEKVGGNGYTLRVRHTF